MNSVKRSKISEIINALEAILPQAEKLYEDEVTTVDSMAEYFPNSKNYDKSCDACDQLNCAIEALSQTIEYLYGAKL